MADLLNIGMSGLHAAKTKLSVTGHNITNVKTPGYTRQDTVQTARSPQFTGAGYIGTGTSLVDVRRSYDEFLTTQVRSSTSLNSDVLAYKSQIDQLDGLLAGTSTGINPSLEALFSATQAAAEDPSNIPARQLVIAEAEGLARRFNNLYDNINTQNSSINKQLVTSTEQINRLAQTIGGLNDAIASAGSNGSQPNDLLDARDEAVRQLSTYVGVNVVVQDNNTFNVSLGSGQPLVVGNTVNQLQAVPGQGDPNTFEVEFVSGGSRQTITSNLSGGEVGGLLRYREDVLKPSVNALGRLAISISDEVNSQLGQGLDLKGQVGSGLFKDINDSSLTGLRVRPVGTNGSNVSGDMKITDTKLLTTSDYRLDFDGTNYSARRLSDGAEMTVTQGADGELSFADSSGRDQGFSVKLSGAPIAGDRFVLEPTRRGAAGISAELKQPEQLGFAAPFKGEADLQNKGTGKITQPSLEGFTDASTPAQNGLSNEALQAVKNVGVRFDAASNAMIVDTPLPAGVTVTMLTADGQTVPGGITPGQSNQLKYSIEVNVGGVQQSFTVSQSISGRPENGDKFSVDFNQNGVSDNRNALKLVDLQNKQSIAVDPNSSSSSNGMSFNNGYGDMVERVGTLTAQARRDDVATGAILKQTTDSRNSLSAVSLDEEAANLIQFEQYYNASAQVIQVARTLFDTLISTLR
ncbi:MAG: flagellar hook-associated protein FlgK [Gammaproteobacteria bacterium]|nr:flagellar hook-associated protein FlgK [Gammaproteobacteria bacterium]